MAATAWSEKTSSVLPERFLVHESDQPDDKSSLLYLLVEYCKRLARDSDLDREICLRLASMEEKQIQQAFKQLSRIQWAWGHQTASTLAPYKPLKNKLQSICTREFPSYECKRFELKMRTNKSATVFIHGLHSYNPDFYCDPIFWILRTSQITKHELMFLITAIRENARLCTLLLVESALTGITSSVFNACFLDIATLNSDLTNSVPTKPLSKATSSQASSSASTASIARKPWKFAQLHLKEAMPPNTRAWSLHMGHMHLRTMPIEAHTQCTTILWFYVAKMFRAPGRDFSMPASDVDWTPEFYEEVEFLQSHVHPCLAPMIALSTQPAAIIFPVSGSFYNSSLHGHLNIGPLNRRDWEEIFEALFSVADGLQYLHSVGRIHGRLAPTCILRSHHGKVKIFDYSTRKRRPLYYSPDFTPPLPLEAIFQAPEVQELEFVDSPSADVYSFGMFMWFLFHQGIDNFTFKSWEAKQIKMTPVEGSEFVLRGVAPLFLRCVDPDPTLRPTMPEVNTELFSIFTQHLDDLPLPGFDATDPDGINLFERRWMYGTRSARY